ncbi:lipid-A-disaccharide synthase N-terminal domain-containing protein [Zunongwangia sp. F363]|uniref:Lipid-A-disaccharide synthase N-terminal domain-containing protein n=1 Tax=Autumnicola tepida TaxID=3075595 RepID=A0ABU3CDJ2_9FLAO|nr:lipid-A-disaccharide synthase N-terminal domain-containing protein [Zunongwangia sp. F363]MDT0644422.1 lipid-A-disaccharide synthase N-terminal domain-containing protein [Zunongwangia sp. F363]
MNSWQIYAVGFTAQILFSSRLLMQWILSERKKKVITPSLFWKISLFASFLLFVYGYLREDFSIMLGQAITYFIYIRNLQLQGEWQKAPKALRWFLYFFPVLLTIYSYNNGTYDVQKLFFNEQIPLWLLIMGSAAQLIFNLRFFYQWIYSEKIKESVLPLGFWLLSLVGALLILTYAIIRKDPVLFAGHVLGSFIYARNILLSRSFSRKVQR